ncbi:MAG: hypothetical protein FWG90_08430 [Oscillospiraceae bacterium]|nr:hypothetical protein [Oscillospiraceae bacterium]
MNDMKASLHGGTSSSKMSVKHNDRKFDINRSKYIDPCRTVDNMHYDIYQGEYYFADTLGGSYMTFEEVEQKYYETTLEPAYLAQKNRYIKNGQYKYAENMGTLEEWIAKQPKPYEMILQIGNTEEHPSEDDFHIIFKDFRIWLNEKYGSHFKILNSAEHYDEATPHAQQRGVWHYAQSDGTIKFSMTRGMKAAGIELPRPDLKEGVYGIDIAGNLIDEPIKKTVKGEDYFYNTRQVTFTKICREKWIEIAEDKLGITIINEPDHQTKHMNTADYRLHRETLKRNAESQRKRDEIKKQAKKIMSEAKSFKAEVEADKATIETDRFALNEEKNELVIQIKRNRNIKKWIDKQTVLLNNREIELSRHKAELQQQETQLKAALQSAIALIDTIEDAQRREQYAAELKKHEDLLKKFNAERKAGEQKLVSLGTPISGVEDIKRADNSRGWEFGE